MRKIFLLVVVVLLNGIIKADAYQPIIYSYFTLLNKTENTTDIAVFTQFSSASSDIPFLNGVIEEISSDTMYFKILYKERKTAGSGSTVGRYDTFTNIALPAGINYLHISGNRIKINPQLEITDTSWNETDSTFVLHPVGMNDISKNSPTIRVYPNPASHILSFDKSIDYEAVQVYNSVGQCVAVYQKNSERSIDISALSKGIYVIKLYGKKAELIGRARFVKTE